MGKLIGGNLVKNDFHVALHHQGNKKRKYINPEISCIKIDNEISLVMMSANPNNDPDESLNINPTENPFKIENSFKFYKKC